MITDEVAEEHNGVYGGKWHIVSPEGFDLPEGLDYLKTSQRKAGCKANIHLSIRCSGISFTDIRLGLENLDKRCVNFALSSLEIVNCFRLGDVRDCLESIMLLDMDNLDIHGCTLTFEDLYHFIESLRSINQLNLSKNKFIFKEEDWLYIERIGTSLNRWNIAQLNLSKSNFSEAEKVRLSDNIKMGIRLII